MGGGRSPKLICSEKIFLGSGRAQSEKSGKFLSAPLIFSFPYAYVRYKLLIINWPLRKIVTLFLRPLRGHMEAMHVLVPVFEVVWALFHETRALFFWIFLERLALSRGK